MSEKLTILVKAENRKFIKRYSKKRKTSISALMDGMIELLKQQEKKSLPLHPDVKKTAGMVKTGSEDPWEFLFGK